MLSSRLSRLADEDTLSIFRYTIKKWSAEQVPVYLSLLEAGRFELEKDPFVIGSKAREDLAHGCRVFGVEKHYFVYRVKDEVVEIGRILHESMDFARHMDEEAFD
jgi:toxin ParE1/3/4